MLFVASVYRYLSYVQNILIISYFLLNLSLKVKEERAKSTVTAIALTMFKVLLLQPILCFFSPAPFLSGCLD